MNFTEATAAFIRAACVPVDGSWHAYHAPETLDDRALRVLVDCGKVNADSLTTMLGNWTGSTTKTWLGSLKHGADPNQISHWGPRALAHALGRTSPLRYFHVLDHAADPTLPSADGTLPAALAARTGRADVLDLLAQRGFPVVLTGDAPFWPLVHAEKRRPRASLSPASQAWWRACKQVRAHWWWTSQAPATPKACGCSWTSGSTSMRAPARAALMRIQRCTWRSGAPGLRP